MINAWWESRTYRERCVVSIGGGIAILLLGYVLLWSPLSDRVSILRNQVQSQQVLLNWMQVTSDRIMVLRRMGYSQAKVTKDSLLPVVEHTLTDQKLSNYLQQVQQSDTDQLTLHFHQVPFDHWIGWLEKLSRESGIVVQQVKITKTKPMGTADVIAVIKV